MLIRKLFDYSPFLALAAASACQHAAVAPAAANEPRNATVSVASAGPAHPLAAQSAAADTSPFVEGVRLGYPARLEIAGRRTFLSTEKLLLAVSDEGVSIEPALLEGLQQGRSQFPRVFGNMPESGWALQTSYADRTSRSSLSRWTGTEWVNADALLGGKNAIGISAWSEGRTLALVESDHEKYLGFVQLGGARGVPLPKFARVAHNEFNCVHGIQPTGMRALASGEVLLTGMRCALNEDGSVAYRGAIMQTWRPGQTRGQISALPGLSEKEVDSAGVTNIVAASGNDVFVAGALVPHTPEGEVQQEQAYLAHFDGTAWRPLSAPPIARIDELQRTPNGALWALYNGELWATTGSASETAVWQHVVMPRMASEAGENAVSSFWVQDNERVWATLGMDGFSYLVRTKPGAARLSVPSDEQIAKLSNALDPMAAYQCETPTLVLLTLSRQAPKDADMPSIRAALRGHTELEGKARFIELPFLTRRYLGVRGDMDTLVATQELLSNANIPGVSPEMRCLDSEPTRTLAVDFSGPKPRVPPSKAAHGASASRAPRSMDLAF